MTCRTSTPPRPRPCRRHLGPRRPLRRRARPHPVQLLERWADRRVLASLPGLQGRPVRRRARRAARAGGRRRCRSARSRRPTRPPAPSRRCASTRATASSPGAGASSSVTVIGSSGSRPSTGDSPSAPRMGLRSTWWTVTSAPAGLRGVVPQGPRRQRDAATCSPSTPPAQLRLLAGNGAGAFTAKVMGAGVEQPRPGRRTSGRGTATTATTSSSATAGPSTTTRATAGGGFLARVRHRHRAGTRSTWSPAPATSTATATPTSLARTPPPVSSCSTAATAGAGSSAASSSELRLERHARSILVARRPHRRRQARRPRGARLRQRDAALPGHRLGGVRLAGDRRRRRLGWLQRPHGRRAT